MDELDVFEQLEENGVILIRADDGLVLGIKREVLATLLEFAKSTTDDIIFMSINEEPAKPDKTELN